MRKYNVTVPVRFDDVEADSAEEALEAVCNMMMLNRKRLDVEFSEWNVLAWDAEVDELPSEKEAVNA
jgi:hypothetical protein